MKRQQSNVPTPPPSRRSKLLKLPEQVLESQCRLFFGGSFNPPHIGHVQLAAHVAQSLNHAQCIFVPAGRSPFKETDPVEDHHRVSMLSIATQSFKRCSIWEQELHDAKLNKGEPSYWADTWSIILGLNMPGPNRFLIGADQAISMHRWHRYTVFWKDAVVVLRDQTDSLESLLAELHRLGVWSSVEIEHWRSRIIEAPAIDASSTEIRAALADPSQRDERIKGLNPAVQSYIVEHKLYQQ